MSVCASVSKGEREREREKEKEDENLYYRDTHTRAQSFMLDKLNIFFNKWLQRRVGGVVFAINLT